jgi:hypothetical protein
MRYKIAHADEENDDDKCLPFEKKSDSANTKVGIRTHLKIRQNFCFPRSRYFAELTKFKNA